VRKIEYSETEQKENFRAGIERMEDETAEVYLKFIRVHKVGLSKWICRAQ
jgi:hypothetical protein